MYGADSFKSVGTSLTVTGSRMMTTGGGGGGNTTTMSPMESMKEVFLEIRDNTAKTVDLLTTLVLRDATQSKKEAIEAGNTDPDPGPKERGPGILSRVMGGLKGAFSSLMPEKGGFMDTLLKLGLAVGGVALLKYFGDDMVPVLADLLKSIKEGKIGENIQAAYEYVKEIGVGAFEKLKVNTILFIDGVKKVMGIIQGAYKAVNDYIMSFDTKGTIVKDGPLKGLVMGDNKLDKQEFNDLKEDLTAKAVTIVGNVISGVFSEFFNFLTSSDTLKTMGKALLLFGPVAMIFGRGKGVGPPGRGFIGRATIIGLLAYGIRQTFLNYEQAIRASVDEMGAIDMKEFAINFLGGANNAAGSADAAYRQAKGMGGAGLLAGMAIGSVIPGVGTIIGGVFGAVAGGIIGYLSGQAGTDRIREIVDSVGLSITGMVNDIGNFFQDVANGFKFLFSGRSFMKGFRRRKEGDVDELQEDIEEQEDLIKLLEKMQVENPSAELEKAISEANKELEKRKSKKLAAPTKAKYNILEDMGDYKKKAEAGLAFAQSRVYGESRFSDNPEIQLATAILPAESNAVDGRLKTRDKFAFDAIGPEGTNYDAMKFYEKILRQYDRRMYGAAVAFANDERAVSMSNDIALSEKTGVDFVSRNAAVLEEKSGYISQSVNGGLNTPGGGKAITMIDSSINETGADKKTLILNNGMNGSDTNVTMKILNSRYPPFLHN